MIEEVIPELIDTTAEIICLGGLCFGEETAIDILSVISHRDLQHNYGENWRILKVAEEIVARKDTITLTMLKVELEKHIDHSGDTWLTKIGGENTLKYLRKVRMSRVSGKVKLDDQDDVEFADIKSAARRVKELSNLRTIYLEASKIAKEAKTNRISAKEAAVKLRELAIEQDVEAETAAVVQSDDNDMMLDHIYALEEGLQVALPTGFKTYDKATGGLHGGDVILLSGLHKGGKSLMALKIIDNLVKSGVPCAIFSLEMSRKEINQRRICMRSATLDSGGIEFYKLRGGQKFKLDSRTAQYTRDIWDTLKKEPLYIADGLFSAADIFMEAERIIRKYGIKVIMFDYLQLVKGNGSLEERISQVSREAKILANRFAEHGVAVISCNQLNKVGQAEHRASDIISSDHTYGSSAPVKDATVITNVNIADTEYYCSGCPREVEKDVPIGGKYMKATIRTHKYKPATGICDKCHTQVVSDETRKGAWIIERARSAQAGIKTEFFFEGKYMHIQEIGGDEDLDY